MDKIINPTQRKWISPPVQLGNCMVEMKRLVRLQKEELLIINPVLRLEAGNTVDESTRPQTSTYVPEYMKSEAMDLNDEEPIDGLNESEELERTKQDKWTDDDAACAAAVAAVGGKDFFLFGKKNSTNDGKKGQRGRRAKIPVEIDSDVEEDDDEYEEDEDDDEDIDDYDPTIQPDGIKVKKLVNSSLYEQYNYDQKDQPEQEDEDSTEWDWDRELQNMLTVEAEEHRQISDSIPEALNESDDEEIDWLEYDNEIDNFAGLAQRLEDVKNMYDTSSEDSDDDKAKLDLSDEEKDNNETTARVSDGCVIDGEIPCSSKSIPTQSPERPTTVLRSALSKGENKGKKQRKSVTINLSVAAGAQKNAQVEDEPSAASSSSKKKTSRDNGNRSNNPTTQEKKKKVPIKDPTADFKNFSEWVFNQNNKRDQESKQSLRSALINQLDLTEKEVRGLQSLTSANLTSVRGEVFQDEAVMQSSSMPLLAPPTNLSARTTLQSLAIFLTHGEDPSVFPWKSINVQQQMNDDFLNHQFLKQMEQQKLDITNPAMKEELVNKEEDFLVQILIYQNTDPEDVLQDEVKLRSHTPEQDVIAASGGKGKVGRQSGYKDDGGLSTNRYVEPKLAYELHMLGSQTVKDLIKAFQCENDYVSLKDIPHPDNYKEDSAQYAKAHFPWSMILIGSTIYSDPNSEIDYLGIINEWAAKPPEKHIGPFKRGDWNTRLRDLTLSFGFPYVYIHLGGCEHVYVFTKCRLLHVEDDHLIKNYPKIVGMTRFKNVYCRVDNEYLARWAVLDFKEFPENPMLLCTECVLMYCYDKNKKKRGEFKLYPFTQLANIL